MRDDINILTTETEKKDRDEELWNKDLIDAISAEIKTEFPNVIIFKGKVLKDIFLYKDARLGNQLQFGFVDQDIVIYDETMDISDFKAVKNIFLHNNKDNRDNLVIPKIICELKYNGITSHGLITYSSYAADIKSIFPECKYFLALRHKKSSSENKLFRHGKYFDKIIFLGDTSSKQKYVPGQFIQELKTDLQLKEKFTEFIDEIKVVLRKKKTHFVK
jgi:hypothetical protein